MSSATSPPSCGHPGPGPATGPVRWHGPTKGCSRQLQIAPHGASSEYGRGGGATAPRGHPASPGSSGRQTGEREQRLEQREQQADEREREADERERAADERERAAQLTQRGAELRGRAASARERAELAVEEAKTELEANRDSVERAVAALRRAHMGDARQRASTARAVTRGGLHPAPGKVTTPAWPTALPCCGRAPQKQLPGSPAPERTPPASLTTCGPRAWKPRAQAQSRRSPRGRTEGPRHRAEVQGSRRRKRSPREQMTGSYRAATPSSPPGARAGVSVEFVPIRWDLRGAVVTLPDEIDSLNSGQVSSVSPGPAVRPSATAPRNFASRRSASTAPPSTGPAPHKATG